MKKVCVNSSYSRKKLFRRNYLWSLSSDSSGQLHVLWHDGDSLGVDGAQVSVFEEGYQISFSGFLEGEDGWGLESQVSLEFLGDLSYESLEWELSDEEFSRFLVSSDFSEGDSSWSISVWFLHACSSRGSLSGGFLSNVFSWCFSTDFFLAVCLVLAILNLNFINYKSDYKLYKPS